jgi:hypothetical protein
MAAIVEGIRAEQQQKIKTIMEDGRQEMNEILDGPQG